MQNTQPMTKRRRELIARIEAAKTRMDRALERLAQMEREEKENTFFKRLMRSLKFF